MRIVSLADFLAMPAGTVFTTYEPIIFGELYIKGDTLSDCDYIYQPLIHAVRSDSSDEG